MSVDEGKNWQWIDELPRDAKVTGFAFDPQQAKHFYALTTKGIWETTDRGSTWQERDVAKGVDYAGLEHVRQTCADILYLPQGDNQLLKSTDAGRTWKPIEGPNLDQGVDLLQVHASKPAHVVLLSRGRYFRSTNAGEQWQELERVPISARTMAMDPADPNVFYLASIGRAVRTRDGGKTFEELSNGLPRLHIIQMDISPVDASVYAGVCFSGVFRLVAGDTPDGASSPGVGQAKGEGNPRRRTADGREAPDTEPRGRSAPSGPTRDYDAAPRTPQPLEIWLAKEWGCGGNPRTAEMLNSDENRPYPVTLTWPMIEGAARYAVQIEGVRGSRPAKRFGADRNTLTLTRDDLPPGRYKWSVKVHDAKGIYLGEIDVIDRKSVV